MSQRGYSHRGKRGGSFKRSRTDNHSRGSRDGGRDAGKNSKPEAIARSPERAPVVVERADLNYIEWPEENPEELPDLALSDPMMPTDLVGVIGYCSDKSINELPATLVTPTDVHQRVQDAKKYLFGSNLEVAMRDSLKEYIKVWYYN